MKTGIFGIAGILVLVCVSLVLAAGCTGSVNNGSTGNIKSNLPDQTETAVLVNGSYAVNATIDQIRTDPSKTGGYLVDIYVNAKNVGTTPIQLRWYSTIIDSNGGTHGGIGVSHGGSGAETMILSPGTAESARDYVEIDSGKDYATLANGGILHVDFETEPLENQTAVNFNATWNLNPTVFT